MRHAPDVVRERLAFPSDSMRAALAAARRDPLIERMVIVSTCQRVELYATLPMDTRDGRARLIAWLAAAREMNPAELDAFAEYLTGVEAVRHLCRVASGLEAAILGESQILSQVSGALRHAVAAHTVTPLLKDVFRGAVQGAERARRLVWSAFRAADIGMAAVDGAERALDSLAGARAVVVGAGEVARLSVRALRERNVGSLTIINRTRERAQTIATEHGAHCAPFEAMASVVGEADVVVVATGAPGLVVDAGLIQDAVSRRTGRVMVIVDTASPRNVDPAVRGLPGAQLLDLSDLRSLFATASAERLGAVAAVEALIEAELRTLLERQRRRTNGRGAPSLALA